jgi:hypothetical protein
LKLKKASDVVTEEAKKIMSQMLLFDVDLFTYAICGRVKDVLSNLVRIFFNLEEEFLNCLSCFILYPCITLD